MIFKGGFMVFCIYFICVIIISFCISLFLYHNLRYKYRYSYDGTKMRYDKVKRKWQRFEFGKWWPEYFRNGVDDELCKEYDKLRWGKK